jgi:hypothetical protein
MFGTFYSESQVMYPSQPLLDTMDGMAKHITDGQRNEIFKKNLVRLMRGYNSCCLILAIATIGRQLFAKVRPVPFCINGTGCGKLAESKDVH